MTILAFALSNWKAIAGALVGLALLIGAAVIYHKGEKAGSANVRSAVERTTNTEIEKARKERENADEKTRNTPYDNRVDGLR
jgi:hypothetical protein